jgi:hypothetical protein
MVVFLATFLSSFLATFLSTLAPLNGVSWRHLTTSKHNLYNDVRATYRRPYDVEFNDVFGDNLVVLYTIYNNTFQRRT